MAEVLPMAQTPFATWDDGLRALADALDDSARVGVIVARLESTAEHDSKVSILDWTALALASKSAAYLEQRFIDQNENVRRFFEDGVAAYGSKAFFDKLDKARDQVLARRQEISKFSALYATNDPRAALLDTIFRESAIGLADISRSDGIYCPFWRLGVRIERWFARDNIEKSNTSPDSVQEIVLAGAQRLIARLPDGSNDFQKVARAWCGTVPLLDAWRETTAAFSMPEADANPEVAAAACLTFVALTDALARSNRLAPEDTQEAFEQLWRALLGVVMRRPGQARDWVSWVRLGRPDAYLPSLSAAFSVDRLTNAQFALLGKAPFLTALDDARVRLGPDGFDAITMLQPCLAWWRSRAPDQEPWPVAALKADWSEPQSLINSLFRDEDDPTAGFSMAWRQRFGREDLGLRATINQAIERRDMALADALLGAWLMTTCLHRRDPAWVTSLVVV